MTVDIHHVRGGNAAILDRIAEEVFDRLVDPGQLQRFLAVPGNILVVAVSEGVVVGQVTAMVHLHPDGHRSDLYIDEVGVTPSLQRRGIARLMLDRTLEIGRGLGCVEYWVGTEYENVAARGLYESYGAEAQPFVMYSRKLS